MIVRLYLAAACGAMAALFCLGSSAAAVQPDRIASARAAVNATANGTVSVKLDVTGRKARFVRINGQGDLMPGVADKSRGFLEAHGEMFGVENSRRELRRIHERVDALGLRIETFEQMHNGVPVFGARLKTTVTAQGALTTVHGALVDNAQINVIPNIGADEAAMRARQHIQRSLAPRNISAIQTAPPRLYIYNSAFTRGREGASALAYEVEVTAGALREFVYVNAHNGKIVDQITGTYDALDRVIYEGGFSSGNIVWTEGGPFPTGNNAWDDLIDYSEDTYNLFSSITQGTYLSWDGNDGTMRAVNNDPAISCPNAQFTGSYIRFCNGTTTDDIVAHEWAHGYTQQTHGLIYRFQSGALNEAYSDIFGEIVDLLNGDGNDAPNSMRTDSECSLFGGSGVPSLEIAAPESVAGPYAVGGAGFNPGGPLSVSASAVGVTPANGCSTISTDLTGKIALIDRGSCNFTAKVLNAQAKNAVGVVVINNAGNAIQEMGGGAAGITIPSVFIGQDDGTTLKNTAGVTASITLAGATDNSYRWLTGEDSTAFGGAIRDMWSPNCFGDPGKVSDARYACDFDEVDNGGVHSNSGIINHGFALLVDGGVYNGQNIAPIGLTKAAHLYWRTMSVYQTPVSGYSDHAQALTSSCQDLLGSPLATLSTSDAITGPSGEIITATDCAQVDAVIAALELNQQPTQCGFSTLLAQDPPALCADGLSPAATLDADFEAGLGAWTTGSRAVLNPATFDVPAWTVTADLPFAMPGQAAFGADPVIGNCGSDNEAGVQYLQSPSFTVPADGRLVFDHSLSTEKDYDGGNLKVSVNGGAWTLVPSSAFIYNAYTSALTSSDNPLSGESAFHGTDGGTFLSQWGQSQVDLTALAAAGQSVRLRFEMGTDGCNGVVGWYVDNVRAYRCEIDNVDTDNDGVADNADNCTLVSNPDQRDTNGDGYGNVCDADLNNDGIVNASDLGLFRAVFFTNNADADFDGDNVVNVIDLGILRGLFFQPPGPSGIAAP